MTSSTASSTARTTAIPAQPLYYDDILRSSHDDEVIQLKAGDLRQLLIDMGFKCRPVEQHAKRTESAYKKNGVRKPTASDPFRTPMDFQAVANYLRGNGQNRKRNYMMIILGTTLGLRCGDLLRIKVGDVYDSQRGVVRSHVTIIEDKTNKRSTNVLTESARRAISDYLKSAYKGNVIVDDPLLCSRQRGADGKRRPLNYTQVWRILTEAAQKTHVNGHIGTHSMRKTYGYSANQTMAEQGVSSAVVMETLQAKFKHSSQSTTLRYIGLEQDNIDTVAGLVDQWCTTKESARSTARSTER